MVSGIQRVAACLNPAVEQVLPVHEKQLLTYLRLAKKPLGLLINFNVPLVKAGIHRVINTPESST